MQHQEGAMMSMLIPVHPHSMHCLLLQGVEACCCMHAGFQTLEIISTQEFWTEQL